MTKARKHQISLDETPYYHCVSRCVRRAFLCGEQFEHRRQWVEEKLQELARIFCINIAAYAVMSNHYHVVLHVERAEGLSDRDVARRWHLLFNGTQLSRQFAEGRQLSDDQWQSLEPDIRQWRKRLMDISWFMRIMNEAIARRANREDGCTGRFWEGRFKSQALLDEKALIACMAYVDLNPIRAGIARTPEYSDHTSIKQRCAKVQANSEQPEELLPFTGNADRGLSFELHDYLELIDWSGRIMRHDKPCAVDAALPPLLERLDISEKSWQLLIRQFERSCKTFAGNQHSLAQICERLGYRRKPGISSARHLFG